MTTTTHLAMHGDHRVWESDVSLWRDDLRIWQHDVVAAQAEIKQLEKALDDHANALRTHAASLRLEEIGFDKHEHELAEYERGGQGGELVEMAKEHKQGTIQHTEHRVRHEQIKRQHHNVIAHWRLLLLTAAQAKRLSREAPRGC